MSKFLAGTALVTFVTAAIVGILFLNALFVMLALGALGHVFEQPALFLSFGESVIVSVALSIIGSFFKGNK